MLSALLDPKNNAICALRTSDKVLYVLMTSSSRLSAGQSGSIGWQTSSDVQGVCSYPGSLEHACMFDADHDCREVISTPRLYGDYEQKSMDWLPYLMQLSPRPAALKHTGIYPMLAQEVQAFLDSCSYQAKKETLRVRAELSEKSSFSKATEAVRSVILHGPRDADSNVAMFNRLNCDITDLAPMVLPASVPEMPSVKPSLGGYGHMLLKPVEAEIAECCKRLRLSRNIAAICDQMEADSYQE
jgi:hypothetical protein